MTFRLSATNEQLSGIVVLVLATAQVSDPFGLSFAHECPLACTTALSSQLFLIIHFTHVVAPVFCSCRSAGVRLDGFFPWCCTSGCKMPVTVYERSDLTDFVQDRLGWVAEVKAGMPFFRVRFCQGDASRHIWNKAMLMAFRTLKRLEWVYPITANVIKPASSNRGGFVLCRTGFMSAVNEPPAYYLFAVWPTAGRPGRADV